VIVLGDAGGSAKDIDRLRPTKNESEREEPSYSLVDRPHGRSLYFVVVVLMVCLVGPGMARSRGCTAAQNVRQLTTVGSFGKRRPSLARKSPCTTYTINMFTQLCVVDAMCSLSEQSTPQPQVLNIQMLEGRRSRSASVGCDPMRRPRS
jgi:hypothetical protein